MTGLMSAPRWLKRLPRPAPFRPQAGRLRNSGAAAAPQPEDSRPSVRSLGAQSRRGPCERRGQEDPGHRGRARSSGPDPAPRRGPAAAPPGTCREPACARVPRATGLRLPRQGRLPPGPRQRKPPRRRGRERGPAPGGGRGGARGLHGSAGRAQPTESLPRRAICRKTEGQYGLT